jgi:hypothetical protein
MATTTPLIFYPLAYPDPTARFLCEAWWTCHSTGQKRWRGRSDCVLAPGHPFSVVPPAVRNALDLDIRPARGWKGTSLTWYGIPCRLGRATVWLPVQETPGIHRDLSMLVLLPDEELTDAAPFVHLGAQFLREYHARVSLDCSPPGAGRLLIP